jgi:hypothetical protein
MLGDAEAAREEVRVALGGFLEATHRALASGAVMRKAPIIPP